MKIKINENIVGKATGTVSIVIMLGCFSILAYLVVPGIHEALCWSYEVITYSLMALIVYIMTNGSYRLFFEKNEVCCVDCTNCKCGTDEVCDKGCGC